jgi:hypothetical protein
MTRLGNRGWLAALAAAILALGAFGFASTVLAAPGTVTSLKIGSATTAPNTDVTVNLTASGTNIGGWGVNVKYDNTKHTIVSCTSTSAAGTCNKDFAGDTFRINGASTAGLNGTDQVLGSVTFHAGATTGTAALTITEPGISDTDQAEKTITPTNGTITIAEATATPTPSASPSPTPKQLPSTGGQPGSDSLDIVWLVAGFAGLAIIAAGAWTLARAREDS